MALMEFVGRTGPGLLVLAPVHRDVEAPVEIWRAAPGLKGPRREMEHPRAWLEGEFGSLIAEPVRQLDVLGPTEPGVESAGREEARSSHGCVSRVELARRAGVHPGSQLLVLLLQEILFP